MAKKIVYKKFLLYSQCQDGGKEVFRWDYINTTAGPDYRNAATLLRRQLHSQDKTKGIEVVKIIHLYNTPS